MKKLIIILGVLGVSFSAIFVRMSTVSSMTLALNRVLFAAIIMCPVVLLRSRAELKNLKLRAFLMCAASGIFLGEHLICFFEAVKQTGIASATVLVDTEVFFVAVIMLMGFKEKIKALGWIGIAVTFAGSVLIALADAHQGGGSITGDIFALVGAVLVAVYTVLGRLCRRTVSTTVYTFLVYSFAAVTILIAALASGVSPVIRDTHNLLLALGLTVFCTILGHSVFSWGLKYEKASFVSVAKLLEPVFSSVLGVFLFAEVPAQLVILGGCCIILGILGYIKSGS